MIASCSGLSAVADRDSESGGSAVPPSAQQWEAYLTDEVLSLVPPPSTPGSSPPASTSSTPRRSSRASTPARRTCTSRRACSGAASPAARHDHHPPSHPAHRRSHRRGRPRPSGIERRHGARHPRGRRSSRSDRGGGVEHMPQPVPEGHAVPAGLGQAAEVHPPLRTPVCARSGRRPRPHRRPGRPRPPRRPQRSSIPTRTATGPARAACAAGRRASTPRASAASSRASTSRSTSIRAAGISNPIYILFPLCADGSGRVSAERRVGEDPPMGAWMQLPHWRRIGTMFSTTALRRSAVVAIIGATSLLTAAGSASAAEAVSATGKRAAPEPRIVGGTSPSEPVAVDRRGRLQPCGAA